MAAFKGTTIKAGPSETKVLDQLSVMDYNDDGYVVAEVRRVAARATPCRRLRRGSEPRPITLMWLVAQEWEQYFALTCEKLNEEEFELLMADIAEAARWSPPYPSALPTGHGTFTPPALHVLLPPMNARSLAMALGCHVSRHAVLAALIQAPYERTPPRVALA